MVVSVGPYTLNAVFVDVTNLLARGADNFSPPHNAIMGNLLSQETSSTSDHSDGVACI